MTGSNVSSHMPLSVFLTTCFRMKADKDFWSSLAFRRLTKRVAHFFGQQAELALEERATEECPA